MIAWRKSSYSSDTANCVEVAATTDAVKVRDSKDPDGPSVTFLRDAWRAFVRTLPEGDAKRPKPTREEIIEAARRIHDDEGCGCDRKYLMSCPRMADAILRTGEETP